MHEVAMAQNKSTASVWDNQFLSKQKMKEIPLVMTRRKDLKEGNYQDKKTQI